MPVSPTNRYTCPITGQVAYSVELPKGWFTIMGEVFSQEAQVPLAQHVIDNPGVAFKDLLAAVTAPPAQP